MQTKIVALTGVKAGPDDGLADGEFIGYASVFGNVDSYGDVVLPGAFADTLAEWKSSGSILPVLWGHNMFDPDYNIGGCKEAIEDEHGLRIHAVLDIEEPKAAKVYRLLKGRRVQQMSFAYDVLDGAPAEQDGEPVYELRKLKLYEVSVVPIGANQETEILAVKAATDALASGVKAGRVLAQKHIDSLRNAWEAIGGVLDAAEVTDQEKAIESDPAVSDEEPPERVVTPDATPKSDAPVARLAAQLNIYALMASAERGSE